MLLLSPPSSFSHLHSLCSPRPWSRLSANPSSVHDDPLLPSSSSSQEASRISRIRLRRMIESGKLEDAVKFHAAVRSREIRFGPVVESLLINCLMKSRRVSDAFQVFDKLRDRNVVTWTSVISGCVQNGKPEKAFPLLIGMMECGVTPNDFSFNAVLQACAAMSELNHGVQIHSLVIRLGMQEDARIGNCLINFYSRCHSIGKAVLVFDSIPYPDVVTFTCMINGFCKNNLFNSATELFLNMVQSGINPNERTVAIILTGCDLVVGRQIHGYMIRTGIQESNIYCSSALIELYSRHDLFSEARKIFGTIGDGKSIVTWSSMISCCIRDGREEDAVKLFLEMINSSSDSPKPNEYTFATIIGGCGNRRGLLVLGLQLHGCVIKLGFSSDNQICNALISMYAKNMKMKESEELFGRFTSPDVATWTGMISGYFQNGFHEKSARILCEMHKRGFKPNEYAFSSAISSCGNLSLLDQGTQMHSLAMKSGCDVNLAWEILSSACTPNAGA